MEAGPQHSRHAPPPKTKRLSAAAVVLRLLTPSRLTRPLARPTRLLSLVALALLTLLPLAACPGSSGWRQPVAAGALGATVAAGVIDAVRNKGGVPDQPCPTIAQPPVTDGCLLGKPTRHDLEERCTYFCLDHCSYHLPPRPDPR